MYLARSLNAISGGVDDLRAAAAAVAADENFGIVAHQPRAVHAQAKRFRQVVARSLTERAKNGVAFDDMGASGDLLERALAISSGRTELASHALETGDSGVAEH